MSGLQKLQDRRRDAGRQDPPARASATLPKPSKAAAAKRSELLAGSTAIGEIDIALIDPNPHQPRIEFDETYIAQISASIEEVGLAEAITVRQGRGDRFVLVAGECRIRAHQKLGRTKIRAEVVPGMTEERAALASLIENLCRDNLSAFEEFHGFTALIEKGFASSQVELAKKVGMSADKLQKIMAFGRLPAGAVERLRAKPSLLGYATAATLASFHNQGHGKLVEEAVDRLAEGKIQNEFKMLGAVKKRLRVSKPRGDGAAIKFAGPDGKTIFRLVSASSHFKIGFQKSVPAVAQARIKSAIAEILKEAAEAAK